VRGETGRAIDMLQRVVKLAPMDLDARNQLIEQYIARGTADEAVEEYIKLAEVYYSLADLSNSRKAYAKALRLAQISDLDTNWQVRVYHRIADIDIQSLNWRQAAQIFEQVVKIKPDDQKANSRLIDLNFRLGERGQALKVLDKYLQYMSAHDRVPEAIQFLVNQVEERPRQVAIRRRLGEAYFLDRNMEEAVNQLNLTLEMLMDLDDRVGAIAIAQRIIEFNPPNVSEFHQILEDLQSN
jgi:tetratricopeptide (TPR) repeat protein